MSGWTGKCKSGEKWQIKRNRFINSNEYVCTQHIFSSSLFFNCRSIFIDDLYIYDSLLFNSRRCWWCCCCLNYTFFFRLRRRLIFGVNIRLCFIFNFISCLVVRVNCRIASILSILKFIELCTKMDISSLSELVLMRQYDASYSQILCIHRNIWLFCMEP